MINITFVVPLNDEVSLLRRGYRAAPKSGVDVKSRSFRKKGCVDNDVPHIIKSAPIAPKILDVDLAIDRK
jgi:hypothetical protein